MTDKIGWNRRRGSRMITYPFMVILAAVNLTWMITVSRWSIGKVDACRPKGHGFDYRSSRHAGILDKSFTHSCLWRFGAKLQYSIRAVSGAPLSSSVLGEAL